MVSTKLLEDIAQKRYLEQALSNGTDAQIRLAIDASLSLANRFFEQEGDAHGLALVKMVRWYLIRDLSDLDLVIKNLTIWFKAIGDHLNLPDKLLVQEAYRLGLEVTDLPGRFPHLAADFWQLHRLCLTLPDIWSFLRFNPEPHPDQITNLAAA